MASDEIEGEGEEKAEPRIISPAELAAELDDLPGGERYVLRVERFMAKEDVIAKGSRIISVIGQVCVSLLPLYYAILSEGPAEEGISQPIE